jgi:hypothetical protein
MNKHGTEENERYLGFRLPGSMVKKLKAEAHKREVSISEVLREAVGEYLRGK